jgi:hypothetical protein
MDYVQKNGSRTCVLSEGIVIQKMGTGRILAHSHVSIPVVIFLHLVNFVRPLLIKQTQTKYKRVSTKKVGAKIAMGLRKLAAATQTNLEVRKAAPRLRSGVVLSHED